MMHTQEELIRDLRLRVAELRREIARKKRGGRGSPLFLCLSAASLLLVASVEARSRVGASADHFVVRDDRGRVRGRFGLVEGGVTLDMLDEDGVEPLVSITAKDDGTSSMVIGPWPTNEGISVWSGPDSTQVHLGSSTNRAIHLSQDRNGRSALTMVGDEEPLLMTVSVQPLGDGRITIKNDKKRIEITTPNSGMPLFSVEKDEETAFAGVVSSSKQFGVGAFMKAGFSSPILLPAPTKK